MIVLIQAVQWIFAPAQWANTALNPSIGFRLAQHLQYSGLSLLFVVLIGLPIGLAIGHTGRGRGSAILISNISRALPTLGLLSALIILLGFGLVTPIIVFVILGVPPLLAGVYAGVESVDRQTVDAARAIGMTEWQILTRVEIPLGLPLIIGGLRAATLQVIATVTVAAIFAYGGFGRYLVDGQAGADYVQMTAGAILVAGLALLVDGLLAIVQKFVVPRGVSRSTGRKETTTAGGGPLDSAVALAAPTQEGN